MCLLANDFDGEVGTVDIVLVARTKGTAGLPGNQYRHYRIEHRSIPPERSDPQS
jgi:hypothetical protein